VLAVGLAAALLFLPAGADALTTTFSFGAGKGTKISNGDYVAAGYSFKVSGPHSEARYVFANSSVTINGHCSTGGSDSITIPLSAGPFDADAQVFAFDVPENEDQWLPSNHPNTSDTYQGSVLVSGVCGGTGLLDVSGGATFSADIQSTSTVAAVKVRFHFVDPSAKGKDNVDCAQASAPACNSPWSPPRRVQPDLAHTSPSLATVPTLLGVDSEGLGSARDEATLRGALNPTGTVTYYVYQGVNCDGVPAGVSTVIVTGPHVPPSSVFTFLLPGTHQFVASYSGDAINDSVTSRCGDEPLAWFH
jgi:hypothetical protein